MGGINADLIQLPSLEHLHLLLELTDRVVPLAMFG
jgi:hypothetical protein